MRIYVKEYDWMWNELGLDPYASRVFAYIYGLTHSNKGNNGYKGNQKDLASALGISESKVSRILSNLTERHLIACIGDLWQSVNAHVADDIANSNLEVANSNSKVANSNLEVANSNSPHTPLYINKSQEKIIKEKSQASKESEACQAGLGLAEGDSFSLALFSEYYRLFPFNAKTEGIKQAAQKEFCTLLPEKQQQIIERLQEQINAGEKIRDSSPLMYIRNFDKNAPPPEGEPHNYNHEDIPPDKFVQPAKYKGEWGMYCLGDVIKYNMETIKN